MIFRVLGMNPGVPLRENTRDGSNRGRSIACLLPQPVEASRWQKGNHEGQCSRAKKIGMAPPGESNTKMSHLLKTDRYQNGLPRTMLQELSRISAAVPH